MISQKHALVFLGCNPRFKYKTPAEKFDAILRTIQYWNEQHYLLSLASVNFLVAPEAVPVLTSVSEKMGREVPCFLLPSVENYIPAISNIVKNIQNSVSSHHFIVVNSSYPPRTTDFATLFKNNDQENRTFYFLKGEKSEFSQYPRLVHSLTGELIGSVEKIVAGRSRALAAYYAHTDKGKELPAERALSLAIDFLGTKTAVKDTFQDLYDFLEKGNALSRNQLEKNFNSQERIVPLLNGQKMTGAEIEKTALVDLGIYFTSFEILQQTLGVLSKIRQTTEYSLDLIGAAASIAGCKIDGVLVESLQGEHHAIDTIYAKQAQDAQAAELANTEKSNQNGAHEKATITNAGENRLRTWLLEAYGTDKQLLKEKFEYFRGTFDIFVQNFGSGDISVGRSAAPVAILGRHLENFGGMINAAAISRECVVLIRKNSKGFVHIRSPHTRQFPSTDINIAEVVKELNGAPSWEDVAQNPEIQEFVLSQPTSWVSALLSTLIRSTSIENSPVISGYDVLIAHNFPENTGFNIEINLMFSFLEALLGQFVKKTTDQQMFDYVSDIYRYMNKSVPQREITTIACAKAGKILPVQFSPIAIARQTQFPDACRLLFCHSGVTNEQNTDFAKITARHSESVKRGIQFIQEKHAQNGLKIKHVRDLIPKKLGLTLDEFYELLQQVPEHLTDAHFLNQAENLNNTGNEQTKTMAQLIPARNILVYMIGEYSRCRELIARLNLSDINGAGRLLRISHDGERVAVRKNGRLEKFRLQYTDELLSDLQKIAAQNPESVPVYEQSGSVQTSSPEIDELVDLLHSINGVLGAHIWGYGAAGGALALVEKSVVDICIERLEKEYYQPRGFDKMIFSSRPVAGCSNIHFTSSEFKTHINE